MGSASEGVLEGVFCQSCGELIDGKSTGYARDCENCSPLSSTKVISFSRDKVDSILFKVRNLHDERPLEEGELDISDNLKASMSKK